MKTAIAAMLLASAIIGPANAGNWIKEEMPCGSKCSNDDPVPSVPYRGGLPQSSSYKSGPGTFDSADYTSSTTVRYYRVPVYSPRSCTSYPSNGGRMRVTECY